MLRLKSARTCKKRPLDISNWRFEVDRVTEVSSFKDVSEFKNSNGDHQLELMQFKWEDELRSQENIVQKLIMQDRASMQLSGVDVNETTDTKPINPYSKFLARLDQEALENPKSVQEKINHKHQETQLKNASSELCRWVMERLCDNKESNSHEFFKAEKLRDRFQIGGDIFQLAEAEARKTSPQDNS